MHPTPDDVVCMIDKYPANMEKIHRPTVGRLMGDAYRSTEDFHMSRRKGGKAVRDCLPNILGYFIVSDVFKELLGEFNIEWLEINLIDHKGRQVERSFHIANLLTIIDCVDLKKSEYIEDPMDRPTFQYTDKLVLNTEKVGEAALFRPLHTPDKFIVSTGLKERIEQQGMTGVSFTPVGIQLPDFLR